MKSLEQLDRWIAGKIKGWSTKAANSTHSPALLEIRRDILEDVRDQLEPKGRGRSVFPYNSISITIAAEDDGAAERYQIAFGGDDGLAGDIRELLVEAGASTPSAFTVDLAITSNPEAAESERPFTIEYSSRKTLPKSEPTTQPPARLTVVKGEAEESGCDISGERVNMGRLKEVIGDRDGLRRRNDIAFKDSETTVSREHAHIRFDRSTGVYRLYDTNSQRGSCVFRDGRRLEVPRGPTRGLALQSGDEIHLGEARLRFEIPS